jgi:hypothetical protein
LYAINLLDAPEQLLSPTQRQHQQMAQSMFNNLNTVAPHPTYRPMYSTVSAVNIMPRQLRTIGDMICLFALPSHELYSLIIFAIYLDRNNSWCSSLWQYQQQSKHINWCSCCVPTQY